MNNTHINTEQDLITRICVTIPVYSETLDPIAEVSLRRYHDICLDKYDICLVTYKGFNATEYKKILGEDITVVCFDKSFFSSTAAYSQLCVNPEFYKAFIDLGYEWMLIYQTDCYLIRDEIDLWAKKGYDYIGAPIIANKKVWRIAPGVGNGGLSLRNLKTFYDICRPDGPLLSKYHDALHPEEVTIEDLYFCQYVYDLYDFKKAPIEDARAFAIDMSADKVYAMGDGLPMGLHAWHKNILLWKELIPELNRPDLINYCKEKMLDMLKSLKYVNK